MGKYTFFFQNVKNVLWKWGSLWALLFRYPWRRIIQWTSILAKLGGNILFLVSEAWDFLGCPSGIWAKDCQAPEAQFTCSIPGYQMLSDPQHLKSSEILGIFLESLTYLCYSHLDSRWERTWLWTSLIWFTDLRSMLEEGTWHGVGMEENTHSCISIKEMYSTFEWVWRIRFEISWLCWGVKLSCWPQEKGTEYLDLQIPKLRLYLYLRRLNAQLLQNRVQWSHFSHQPLTVDLKMPLLGVNFSAYSLELSL